MLGFPILIDAAVKSSVVLAAAAGAAWTLRRRSAAVRHLVWTAAAAAVLALPLLAAILPALAVPAQPSGPMAVFRVFSSDRVAPITAQATAARRDSAWPSAPPAIDWTRWAVGTWAAGAAIGFFQMLLACGAVWRLRRPARRIDDGGLAAELGIGHPVEILLSDRTGMPMTCGVLRPAVLLPADAAAWRPERLRAVLLHELAHVRRGDVATHLLARTALALYWWNPLAWMAWREFLRERERATDDLVLHAGERASEYASHLLDVARSLKPATATAWAAIAMARRSELEGRLVAILDEGVSRRPSGRRSAIAAVMAAVILIAPFAAVRAQDPSVPPEAEATIRAANAQKNHEILDRAAAAYEKVARFDVAQKLLEQSLSIRAQAGSAVVYAAGLVKLGDLAVRRGQRDEALAFYQKAVSLGDRPEVAGALVYLGQRALGAFDRTAAEGYFDRALRLESSGPHASEALMWMGIMRMSSWLRDEAGAEQYFQQSLAVNPMNLQTITNYARMLRRQKRLTEADEMDARASEVLHQPKPALEAAVNSQNAFRVGNGVTAPSLLYKVEPEYTEEARSAKFQGTVLLYVEVAPDGTAQNIAIRRGLGLGLDEKAIEAIRRWKFKPGTKDGVPVTVQATIEVNFRLL